MLSDELAGKLIRGEIKTLSTTYSKDSEEKEFMRIKHLLATILPVNSNIYIGSNNANRATLEFITYNSRQAQLVDILEKSPLEFKEDTG